VITDAWDVLGAASSVLRQVRAGPGRSIDGRHHVCCLQLRLAVVLVRREHVGTLGIARSWQAVGTVRAGMRAAGRVDKCGPGCMRTQRCQPRLTGRKRSGASGQQSQHRQAAVGEKHLGAGHTPSKEAWSVHLSGCAVCSCLPIVGTALATALIPSSTRHRIPIPRTSPPDPPLSLPPAFLL
jgi:hypothetical protein